MKTIILPLALALAAGAVAEDEWVSVGASRSVAPAQPDTQSPSSSSSLSLPSATHHSASSEADADSSDLLSELLLQLEQMQQEIAELRSQVESQGQQLSVMERDQQARYLDLDRRVATLSQPKAALKPIAAGAGSAGAITESAAQTTSQTNTQTSTQSPAEVYKAAMTLVREKKYSEANNAFTAFVQQYPNDKLVANAWYWNGEVYLVQSQFEAAKNAFEQVVQNFSGHGKAADATYKLGVTFHKLGDDQQARRWLTRVIEQYEGQSDATVRLAKSYLKKLPTAQ
ncbi:tol-pal system protein YbgF [Bacterioplanoides sp.]|uniref:tol-pal system protein YbgF n=1 Tax=Bacterioplanoides sp. TaxID=2066072 RepID=UPI003B001EBD